MIDWELAQKHEKEWWGNAANTLGEEIKQLTYAKYMGLPLKNFDGVPYIIDLHGSSVLDIGGGPCSLLLKSINGTGTVIDPCGYPKWVEERYYVNNIQYIKEPAENEDFYLGRHYSEAWLYNCLQHVQDPQKIIENIKSSCDVLRIFEWIDFPTNEMHPHSISMLQLDEWIGQKGKVTELNTENLTGKVYFGIFNLTVH